MIIYNGKDSFNSFGLYPASKEIPSPVRKIVTDTVPYMSGLWDFSQDEYEPIKIKYTFDVIGENKRDLNAQKNRLLEWINIPSADGRLYDTDISAENYFSVYNAVASWSEEDLQGLLTAEFTCYPFMKTPETEITKRLSSTASDVSINVSGVRSIYPIITVSSSAQITYDGVTYTFTAGTFDSAFKIAAGENTLSVKGSGNLTLKYWGESFC